MCDADSTLEPAEGVQTGFLGWGFRRRCGDFEGLRVWAERWRAFDLRGFLGVAGLHRDG